MRPEFVLRLGTQDALVFQEVMLGNCYRLPAQFDPSDRIIDVGANIGCFAAYCLTAGCGPLTVVEPHPDNIAVLRRNLAAWAVQVRLVQAALYWKTKGEWVPLCDRGPHSAMHFVGRFDGSIGVTVPRITLDELLPLPTGEAPTVRLLKLDCEGGEYPGLFEADRLLSCREVIVECHPVKLGDQHLTDGDARGRLEAVGFEITDRAAEPGGNVVIWARNRKL